jgi:hypothetical protein
MEGKTGKCGIFPIVFTLLEMDTGTYRIIPRIVP